MASGGEMAVAGPVRLRTAPELATLLLELGRLVRARRFYPPGDARLAAVFERSLRAWRSDLERRGALELDLLADGFREVGASGLLAHPQLAELQRDLAERGVQRLRFEASLDGEAFAAFAEVLATDAGRTASRGGFAAALYAHSPAGVRVNDLAPEAATPPPPTPRAPARSEGPGDSLVEVELSSSDDLHETPPSHDLDVLLRQLDECESTSGYLDLARRTVREAERAWQDGRHEEAFRAFCLFAAHAQGKTPERSRELAESFLRSLVQGERLDFVIRRALAGIDTADFDASQVLLAVGEATVPVLLESASQSEGATRDRLVALVVTFGERAIPIVLERLSVHEAPARVRSAIRAAGELQHPNVVPRLGALLEAGERSVREEAVRALVRVGSDAAVGVLAGALDSTTPGLAVAAMGALGSTGSARAVEPVRRVLDRALEARDVPRAKEAIRTLGRLGRTEATRALVGVLERRVLLGGGWLRELKTVAASALAGVPGDEAVAALAQAAQARDTQLRRAAQTALDRRAQPRPRSGG